MLLLMHIYVTSEQKFWHNSYHLQLEQQQNSRSAASDAHRSNSCSLVYESESFFWCISQVAALTSFTKILIKVIL